MIELSQRIKEDLDNLQALEIEETYDIVVAHHIDKSIIFDIVDYEDEE